MLDQRLSTKFLGINNIKLEWYGFYEDCKPLGRVILKRNGGSRFLKRTLINEARIFDQEA